MVNHEDTVSGAGKPSHRATIRWRGSRELAEVLLAAISPDDPDAFEARIEASDGSGADSDSGGDSGEAEEVTLVIETAADSVGSVRATLDDLLSCLAAAESAVQALDSQK